MKSTIICTANSIHVYTVLATFNFNNYPECAQSILYNFAPSQCDYGSDTTADSQQTNLCLCSNSGWISDSAKAIYHSCGCQDLTTSAQISSDNCATTDTLSVISIQDYIEDGTGGSSSCWSKGLDPGTIVGIVFGVITFIGVILGLLQLVVAVLGLPQRYAPWMWIQKLYRRCCCSP